MSVTVQKEPADRFAGGPGLAGLRGRSASLRNWRARRGAAGGAAGGCFAPAGCDEGDDPARVKPASARWSPLFSRRTSRVAEALFQQRAQADRCGLPPVPRVAGARQPEELTARSGSFCLACRPPAAEQLTPVNCRLGWWGRRQPGDRGTRRLSCCEPEIRRSAQRARAKREQ